MPRKKTKQHQIRKDTSFKKKGTEKKKRKAPVKSRVPKTHNCGTWTEAMYFQRIRSALRNAFRYWKPILKALENASRPYQGPNKRMKKEYQCNCCQNWFPRTQVQVDHVEECGSLSCYEDIVPFLKRLTREEEAAFQVLCKPCHKNKTDLYHQNKKVA